MIDRAVSEVEPLVGTAPACRALGASRASLYRRRNPPGPAPARPRPAPARALSGAEREAVLEQLHSERFVDSSPAQVWATLLDEGTYLASERTMYRLLQASGEVSERRERPPALRAAGAARRAAEPGLVLGRDQAARARQGTYFYAYVILDVFSR